ncbi:MAG: response regulator transcription factor [Coriobacteriales bacterium]|nr:response regulator transcription factor [Coriobacteriales bacterium]
MATRLLLAEDTHDLNRALTTMLEHEGYEVVSAHDGEEAADLVAHQSFDGIVLDIMMPKKDGLEVLRELRADGVYTPVLLLTAKAEVDDRVSGLDAGADDYLTKPFAMKELLARVRSMTRRRTDYAGQNLSYGDISLDAETFALSAGNTVRLSVKEFELMQMLVLNADRDLTSTFLVGHVWHKEPDADEETVDLYVSYLRSKLKWVGSRLTIGADAKGFRLVARGDQA